MLGCVAYCYYGSERLYGKLEHQVENIRHIWNKKNENLKINLNKCKDYNKWIPGTSGSALLNILDELTMLSIKLLRINKNRMRCLHVRIV